MRVIKQAHDEVVAANLERRSAGRRGPVKVLDWDGYRADMYMRLRNALAEAGYGEAAVRLDQHRARQ